MQIFFLRRHPAPDMTLGFVHVKYFSRLRSKRWIDLRKAFCDIFMYRAFTYPEMLRSLPDRGIVLDNISCNLHRSFFNITFQKKSPALLVFTLYAEESLNMSSGSEAGRDSIYIGSRNLSILH